MWLIIESIEFWAMHVIVHVCALQYKDWPTQTTQLMAISRGGVV
jgi:hypothetical protein